MCSRKTDSRTRHPKPVWLRWTLRAVLAAVVLGLSHIAVCVAYSLSESGRCSRLLRAMQGRDDRLCDAILTRVGLLPPLPSGQHAGAVMLSTFQSIRPLTPDEYASLLDSPEFLFTAIQGLEKAGDPRAVRPMFGPFPPGMGQCGDQIGIWRRVGDGPFLELLRDRDKDLRWKVVRFLAGVHPEAKGNPLDRSFPPLLSDPDPDVRIAAAAFLAKRRHKGAIDILTAEFNALAQDEGEEFIWMRQAQRGEITAEEFVLRRTRFCDLLAALRESQDPAALDLLQGHLERQAAAKEKRNKEAMDATFGPEDADWGLYVHLVPEPPNLGHYPQTVTTQHRISISPPYIVPAQNKASEEAIKSAFGAPARESASVTWEVRSAEGKPAKVTGTMWAYPSGLEILLVNGRAEYVKPPRPDRRML